MVSIEISLVSETTGLLLTHYGSLFVDFLGGLPLDSFTFDLQFFVDMDPLATLLKSHI